MFNINEIEKNKFFKEKILKPGEILFDEWDLDENIYIVKSWNLSIEKYFSVDKKEKKLLAILRENSIFWEGSLNNNNPKEVLISAISETKLFYIKGSEFKNFLIEFPDIWISFLTNIIDLSNKRLLEANFLLTSNYKISQIISEEKEFSNKNLFFVIDEFLKIIQWEYVIYAEVNEVVTNYANIIYDTRKPGKMSDEIFEIENLEIDLEKLKNLTLTKNNLIVKLKNANSIIWFFIIWEKENKPFSESEKKSINSIWVLLAWFIKQKQYFQNEKNREFL